MTAPSSHRAQSNRSKISDQGWALLHDVAADCPALDTAATMVNAVHALRFMSASAQLRELKGLRALCHTTSASNDEGATSHRASTIVTLASVLDLHLASLVQLLRFDAATRERSMASTTSTTNQPPAPLMPAPHSLAFAASSTASSPVPMATVYSVVVNGLELLASLLQEGNFSAHEPGCAAVQRMVLRTLSQLRSVRLNEPPPNAATLTVTPQVGANPCRVSSTQMQFDDERTSLLRAAMHALHWSKPVLKHSACFDTLVGLLFHDSSTVRRELYALLQDGMSIACGWLPET